MTDFVILLIALVAAGLVGLGWRRRSGRLRRSAPVAQVESPSYTDLLTPLGAPENNPVVLHFSADWCAPCSQVRRVVANVTEQLANTAHPPVDIEIDIDQHPQAAQTLNVLSLPTTFVFDRHHKERFRISGVPKTAELHDALASLTD